MKAHSIVFILLLSLITFSCDDNTITDLGVGIQPTSDRIIVASDLYPLSTENYFAEYFISSPDSFLLGSYYDELFGTTQADILAQVQPPLNNNMPQNFVGDSAKVFLSYKSWFGFKYSPMEVNIYEMNKGTFEYSKPYLSNLNIDEYTDKSRLIGSRIFSPKDPVTSRTDTTSISFKLNGDFMTRFKPIVSKKYTNSTDFLNSFKGLYITSNFGTASMLYVTNINMIYYYSYKYANEKGDSVKVNLSIVYPASPEVRQVNRVVHPDKAAVQQQMSTNPQLTHVSSPANVYTRLKLPLKNIRAKMNVGTKSLNINNATIKFYIDDYKKDTANRRIANYLLLIKESEFSNFFKNKELPSDSIAILGSLSREIDNNGNLNYFYSFSMSGLLASEFKNTTTLSDNLNMLLVPVSVSYDANKSLKEIKQQNLMNSVTLCSGSHSTKPLNLTLVYSGF